METLKYLNFIISIIFTVCYFYQFLYIPISILFNPIKKKKDDRLNHYAILICGRNEEMVIGDLIDSIHEQTYDQKYINIFVMADNCTDQTYQIARKKGATAYQRFNKTQVGKGYALARLRQHINKDYPKGFDAYIVLDADNVLDKDYLKNINDTFNEGYDIITSYRNSKNYSDNWISAGYALWFLRECRFLSQARNIIGSSCLVGGTGFLFSRKIAEEIKDWPYFTLTEDIEFSIDQICKGRKIGYCKKAILYDEQPTTVSQSYKQRLRWSKGYLQVLRIYWLKLIKGILHMNFSCFDVLMSIAPAFILSFVSLTINLTLIIASVIKGEAIYVGLMSILELLAGGYFILLAMGIITTICEWHSIKAPLFKKIIYNFTFPLFVFTYLPISIIALFKPVKWEPITHSVHINKANL